MNPHPRDKFITFKEEGHIYYVYGKSNYTSVTTWLDSFFPKFDADKVIARMMNSWYWRKNKYFGKTPDEIKEEWEIISEEARNKGTDLHNDIECFYNGMEVNNTNIDYVYFQEFHKEYIIEIKDIGIKNSVNLKPYKVEWRIYDEGLRIAGSIDMLYELPNGDLVMYDWKRSKKIKFENKYPKALPKCLEKMYNCNFSHYTMQLNIYKAIIERNYGKKVVGMFIVCMHPDNDNESYQRFEIPDMSQEVEVLFELRMKLMDNLYNIVWKDIIDFGIINKKLKSYITEEVQEYILNCINSKKYNKDPRKYIQEWFLRREKSILFDDVEDLALSVIYPFTKILIV